MRVILALTTSLALVACSGSSSETAGGNNNALRSLQLLFDTGADSTAELTGQLQIVALERTDGSLTANLLGTPMPVVLADPLAAPSGVQLHGIPRAVYTAAQVSFVPGSLRAHLGNGSSVPVRDVALPVRIAFAEPMDLRGAAIDWFQVRHGAALRFTGPAAGPLVWQPQLDARLSDTLPVFGLRTSLLSANLGRLTAEASVPAWGSGNATLIFRAAPTLTLGGNTVSAAELLGQVGNGLELEVDALVQGAGRVWVLAAREVRSRPAPGGNISEVVGVITDLGTAASSFKMRVLNVIKAGAALANQTPPTLEVLADGATKVKWVPRAGRSGGAQVGFGALRDGMMVEVRWHGAANQGVVTAQKIDITAGGPGRHNVAVGGNVASVAAAAGELVLQPNRGPLLTIGGRSYATAVLEFEPDAILVHQLGNGELQRRSLGATQVGDIGWVLGRPRGGNRLRATLLVTLTP